MRNIIGQNKSAFNLREVMDNKKILLVNLSKGRLGDLNAKLLGIVFVMKFQAAAMSRANIPESERADFSLYVDEFQNFSTDSFATIMSEARKYHFNLIVANQFTTQLTPEIRDAVFGNMGTIVSFRVGQNDVDSLGKYFQPIFDFDDLLRVPNYNTIVRTLIGGVPTQPFSMATLPALGTPNSRLSEALKQLSAAKYGKPKNLVEQAINERMATKEVAGPAFPLPGTQPVAPSSGAASTPLSASAWPPSSSPVTPVTQQSVPSVAGFPSSTVPPAPAKGASFLDEWLNKRRHGLPSPSLSKVNTPVPRPAPTPAPPIPVGSSGPLTGVPPAVGPPPAPATPSKNISSGTIEQNEVDKIAAELKQQLNTAKPTPKTEDTIDLQRDGHGDTIYIDREGEFHTGSTGSGTSGIGS